MRDRIKAALNGAAPAAPVTTAPVPDLPDPRESYNPEERANMVKAILPDLERVPFPQAALPLSRLFESVKRAVPRVDLDGFFAIVAEGVVTGNMGHSSCGFFGAGPAFNAAAVRRALDSNVAKYGSAGTDLE